MKKPNSIRARLTIYGHEKMSDKQFKLFKSWILETAKVMQKHKRGELSETFRATLYK